MDFSTDSSVLQHQDFLYKLRKNYNFYIDSEIFSCSNYEPNNIGYIIESRSFVKDIIYHFKLHYKEILNNFELMLVNDLSLIKLDSKIKWAPPSFCWIKNPGIRNKTKLVSMITSNKKYCEGHIKRIAIANQLKDHVDLFGRGFNAIQNKEEGLDDYMFSVAIENDQYAGYFTEKIIDCFATGTIPVYLGDPKIYRYFNPDGIIILDDKFDIKSLTSDLYYSKINAVKENFEKSKQFFSIQNYIYNNYLKGEE